MSKPPGGPPTPSALPIVSALPEASALPAASASPAGTDAANREIDMARIATELRCRTATLQESVRWGSVFLTRAFQCRQQARSESDNANPAGNWCAGQHDCQQPCGHEW